MGNSSMSGPSPVPIFHPISTDAVSWEAITLCCLIHTNPSLLISRTETPQKWEKGLSF